MPEPTFAGSCTYEHLPDKELKILFIIIVYRIISTFRYFFLAYYCKLLEVIGFFTPVFGS